MNAEEEVNLKLKHLDASSEGIKRIMSTPLQRVLSRAVYAEEYEASIQECMQGSKGGQYMTLVHRMHVKALQKNPALSKFVQQLREIKEEREQLWRAEGRATGYADCDEKGVQSRAYDSCEGSEEGKRE